jgi:hypothetical protein
VGCPDFKPGEVCKTGLVGSTPASSANHLFKAIRQKPKKMLFIGFYSIFLFKVSQ